MISRDIPISEERAVETGQQSQPTELRLPKADTVGYFEPHQMEKLAKNGRLYVIADSVGGAASGQMAGQYAVKKILRLFFTTDTPDLEARLHEAIKETNKDILAWNQEHPDRRPLATYITAAFIHNNKLVVANVGDGRVYVVWDQDIERLTIDSSTKPEDNKEQEQGDNPKLISEKASTPSDKSTKRLETISGNGKEPLALGQGEAIQIETFSRRLFAGDTVVLCSGSLTGYVSEKEIAEAISMHAPDQAIDRLMSLAAERGNRGHIAVSVTKVLSSPAAAQASMPMVMPTPPKWSDWEAPVKPITRPLSKPIPPITPTSSVGTRPMPVGQKRKSTSVEIPLSQPRGLPWRSCLVVGLILLVLCGLPILAGPFLLTSDVVTSVPFLRDAVETIRTEAAALGIEFPETEAPVAEESPPETSAAAPMPESAANPPAEAPVVAQGNSPLPTPTTNAAVAAPAETPTPTASPTPALPTPTIAPTLAPTIAIPPNCENKARFVTDVTVEDGTQFPPGSRFEKTWRVRNEGTCPWGSGYTIRFLNGDFFGANQELPIVEVTAPEENGDVSVPMIAPAEAGNYRGVWQLYDLAGQAFGPTMYLEIEVVLGAAAPPGDTTTTETAVSASDTVLYDFIENAPLATWLSNRGSYAVQQTSISEDLDIPDAGGLVALGIAELRGNVQSDSPVLLTYPDLESGAVQGVYTVDTPLQPTDVLVGELGFPRLSILSDDGVTFEVSFTPDGGEEVISILAETVQYRDSPVTVSVPLSDIQAGQTGNFTLRILSGDSTSQDWALWIDLRLVRP